MKCEILSNSVRLCVYMFHSQPSLAVDHWHLNIYVYCVCVCAYLASGIIYCTHTNKEQGNNKAGMPLCYAVVSQLSLSCSLICKQISSNIHTSTNLLFKESPQSWCFQYFIGHFTSFSTQQHRHTSNKTATHVYRVQKAKFLSLSLSLLLIFARVCLFFRVRNIIKTRTGGHLVCYYTKC